MKKTALALGLASLLSVSSACKIGELLYESGPFESVPIEPIPEYYGQRWAEMERCTGRTGNFDVYSWFKFPDVGRYTEKMGFHDGYRKRIFLNESEASNGLLIGHEIVHALGFWHEDIEFTLCGVQGSWNEQLPWDEEIPAP